MCEFCEDKKPLLKEINDNMMRETSSLSLKDNDLTVFFQNSWDDIRVEQEFNIKFCPMCGNKLN